MRALEAYLEGLTVGQGRYAGQPFTLLPWQRRFLRGAFGQDDDAALSMARGNGKTTFVAGLAAATVDVDGPLVEPMAESLVVASSFDQGLICFRHIQNFLAPAFEKWGVGGRKGRYRVQDSANRATIQDRHTGAMLRVMGSDPRRLHGAAPKIILQDEEAQWPATQIDRMLAALETARGKIPESRALRIGTRPATPDHPFAKALAGGVGFSQCHNAGDLDPPFQQRTWHKANPSLKHLPDLLAVLKREARNAKKDPDKLASFRALRLNMGVGDVVEAVLLDAAVWQRIEADGIERRGGYALAIDAGQTVAMSAAAAFWPETGAADAFAVLPAEPTLAAKGLADGVGAQYVRMQQRGELEIAGQYVSDLAELLRRALARWGRPAVIVTDRWREGELREKLAAANFPQVPLVIRGQGFRDGGEDVRTFRRVAVDGLARPPVSLLLRHAVGGARVVGDPAGNWKLAKAGQGGRRSRLRDDAAAALILAVAEGWRRRDLLKAAKRPAVKVTVI